MSVDKIVAIVLELFSASQVLLKINERYLSDFIASEVVGYWLFLACLNLKKHSSSNQRPPLMSSFVMHDHIIDHYVSFFGNFQ